MAQIKIFDADDGWKPSVTLVRSLLKRMKKAGLKSIWDFCFATKYHDLIFCDGGKDITPAIEAKLYNKQYSFYTDSGQRLNA